jgi:hypothetical protein
MWTSISSKEEYRRRNHEREAKYKKKLAEESLANKLSALSKFGRLKWRICEIWENRNDRVPMLLVLFTAALFAATTCLALATRSLVRDGEDTSERQLRAYVHLGIIAFQWPTEKRDESDKITQKPDRYGVTLNVTNSGRTWARNLVVRTQRVAEISKNNVWDSVDWKNIREESIVLGPGQNLPLQLPNIFLTEVPEIAQRSKGYEYFAWITYDDAFDPGRNTQIAMSVDAGSPYGEIAFGYLAGHNCADDDCPKQ